MTITVNAPNGAVVNFPDGTTTDTIKSVMAKNFGGPKSCGDKGRSWDERRASVAECRSQPRRRRAPRPARRYLARRALACEQGDWVQRPDQRYPPDVGKLAGSA